MISIQNERVAVAVENNGRKLVLHDRVRNVSWALDEASAICGGRVTTNETILEDKLRALPPLKPLKAVVANTVKAANVNTADTAVKTAANATAVAGDRLIVTYKAGDGEATYTYRLLNDGVEVRLSPPRDAAIETMSMPGAFAPQEGSMKLLLPIMQGMLWDGRGGHMDKTARMGSHQFSMQMYGILGDKAGLLCANITTVDSFWRYWKDEAGFGIMNIQESSLGVMGYDRIVRFYFTGPTIKDVCKRYRRHVKEQGRFYSWEEKRGARPQIDRLFGALMCYIGYCHDDLNYVAEFKKLVDYGFDRILAYPVLFNCYDLDFLMGGYPPIRIPDCDIEAIKALGVDVCPWSWLNEAIDTHTAERDRMYRISRDGNRVFGWQIDDYKWYKVCSPEIYRYEVKAAGGACANMTWDHFDVLTCATIGECYAMDHISHLGAPLSRQQDMEWLKQTLNAARAENGSGGSTGGSMSGSMGDVSSGVAGGRLGASGAAGAAGARVAISSECFNDLFSMEYDMGSCKAFPQYGPWIFWPVPLTSLVYHDSMMHTWYEIHNYNASQLSRAVGPNLFEYGGGRPDSQSALDALTGSPPDVFPFGTQYGWTGRGAETFAYRFRFEDPLVQYALEKAMPVAKLHRKIGMLEMVDYEILSEDGWVQRSAFADGTEVIANFGVNLRNDIEGVQPLLGNQWISHDYIL